ncbi:MAG: HTTM domain-containing protein [Bdellovibrionales bacterium]|nr:HTTM domain-containing protein [Bdellovibrionales bacterium]
MKGFIPHDLQHSCSLWNPQGIFYILNIPCSNSLYQSLIYISGISSVFAVIGLFFPITSKIAALSTILVTGYNYNFLRTYHSYHLLVMILLILSFSKAHARFSVDSLFKKFPQQSASFRWPMQLCRVYVVYVYSICGVQKLVIGGLNWISGENLFLLLFLNPQNGVYKQTMLQSPLWFFYFSAFWAAIVCELLAPLALISPVIGFIYWFIWLSFHFGVQLTLGDHTSFFTQFFASSIFLIPLVLHGYKKAKEQVEKDPDYKAVVDLIELENIKMLIWFEWQT